MNAKKRHTPTRFGDYHVQEDGSLKDKLREEESEVEKVPESAETQAPAKSKKRAHRGA